MLEEPMDLMTRLQPFLPSLLLESEVEFVRGAKVRGFERRHGHLAVDFSGW